MVLKIVNIGLGKRIPLLLRVSSPWRSDSLQDCLRKCSFVIAENFVSFCGLFNPQIVPVKDVVNKTAEPSRAQKKRVQSIQGDSFSKWHFVSFRWPFLLALFYLPAATLKLLSTHGTRKKEVVVTAGQFPLLSAVIEIFMKE